MAGEDRHNRIALPNDPLGHELPETGYGRRRRGLAADARTIYDDLRRQNRRVRDRRDNSIRLANRPHTSLKARGISNADRSRDRFRLRSHALPEPSAETPVKRTRTLGLNRRKTRNVS